MSVVALAPEVADATKKRYELMEPRLLAVKDLIVPPYQRDTDLGWCQEAAGEFNTNLFLPIVVERSNGNKWSVNQGCHRVEIARILGIPEVWACIAKTDSPGGLFVDAQQKQRALTAYQQHHALRVDRVAQALRVDSLLRSYELRAAPTNQTPGTVNGITMLYRLMFGSAAKIGRVRKDARSYEPELLRALDAIKGSWGPVKADHHSRGSVMIEGLAEIFAAHPSADDGRVRLVLSHNDPVGIMNRSETKRGLAKGTRTSLLAFVILDDYNNISRSGRLAAKKIARLW